MSVNKKLKAPVMRSREKTAMLFSLSQRGAFTQTKPYIYKPSAKHQDHGKQHADAVRIPIVARHARATIVVMSFKDRAAIQARHHPCHLPRRIVRLDHRCRLRTGYDKDRNGSTRAFGLLHPRTGGI